jgi:hypothetical protein
MSFTQDINQLKVWLIKNGPLSSQISEWGHAIVLAGYGTVKAGDLVYPPTIYPQSIISQGDSLIGKTYWIYKNSWGENWGEEGYFKFVTPSPGGTTGDVSFGPFTPPTNHAYWPAGFDGTVSVVDKDNDGYCNWGISDQPPAGSIIPANCKKNTATNKYVKDCDDSKAELGPFKSSTDFNCSSNSSPVSPLSIYGPWVVDTQSSRVYVGQRAQFTSTYGGQFNYSCGQGGTLSGLTNYGTFYCTYNSVGQKTVTISNGNAILAQKTFEMVSATPSPSPSRTPTPTYSPNAIYSTIPTPTQTYFPTTYSTYSPTPTPIPTPTSAPIPTVQSNQSRIDAIAQLYITLLKRSPDQAGLNYFVNSGYSIDQIRSLMMNSTEYRNLNVTRPSPSQSPSPSGSPQAFNSTNGESFVTVLLSSFLKPWINLSNVLTGVRSLR